MENRYLTNRFLVKFVAILILIVVVFYIAAYEQILYSKNCQSVNVNSGNTGSIYGENVVDQYFSYNGDKIKNITVKVGTFQRINNNSLTCELYDVKSSRLLWAETKCLSDVEDNSDLILTINQNVESGNYHLHMYSKDGDDNNAVVLYYNKSNIHNGQLRVGDKDIDAELEMTVNGGNKRVLASYYWIICLLIIVLSLGYIIIEKKRELQGKKSWIVDLCGIIDTYKFLIKQLVTRDFKTRYKRSVLGVVWSFLNPLLTMIVQYIVFSTLFRANIPNYPVYLLSATILFGFFTEAVGGGLASIVGNASLITKVYAPKYVYPITKVFSSSTNLFMSLIPLVIVVYVTGEGINIHYLLIPYVLVCLMIFCIGLGLILATANVFFRDTQFLWGIISLLWMYATPMFYPASIIPARFKFVLDFNPMYTYISFFRTILLEHTSPELIEYLKCAGWAGLFLLIGGLLFQKLEKKFILYL